MDDIIRDDERHKQGDVSYSSSGEVSLLNVLKERMCLSWYLRDGKELVCAKAE